MPKEDWATNTIPVIFSRAGLWPWKDGEIKSVLDVACGLSLKSKWIPAQIRVGVDIYPEYFEYIEAEVPYVVMKYDVRKLNEICVPKSFDLVVALDIIEHIEKHEAVALIEQCEKIARRAVILETPKGYVPQNIDVWGYEGHEWHTHRCGWDPHELEAFGYTVLVRDYVMQSIRRHTEIEVDPHIQLMDAIKFLG